jgi:multiple sugar transport system substrate-binding protein
VTGPKDDVRTRILGRSINRRRLVQGAAVAGAAASTVFSAPAVLGQDKQPVTFWTTHTGIGWEALQKIAQDFNAQSDQFQVEAVQRPPADVADSSSLITAVRGGEGPDVYLLDRFIVAERAANGLLQDLTQLMEDAGENPDLNEKFVAFSAAEATYQGAPYALPFDTDVRALFYNKDLLEEAGVDLEPFDSANGPMLWDDLKEVAKSLNKEEGGNYSQVGFVPYQPQGWLYTYGFSWGGEFFDYENCQVTPDNEKVVQAAQWVYDYCKEMDAQKLYAFVQNGIRDGAPPTDNPFIQKREAMWISGNWEFANFEKYIPDVNVGYTYIPVPEAGMDSSTWAGGWSGVVPQGAKNAEGGYAFAQYLCGPEGSRTYVEMNNNLPVLKELLESEDLFDENLKWFVDNLFPGTKFRPPLPVGAKYWTEQRSAWEAIYLNQSDPQTALATCKQNTQGDLDAGGFCPIAAPAESGSATPES